MQMMSHILVDILQDIFAELGSFLSKILQSQHFPDFLFLWIFLDFHRL